MPSDPTEAITEAIAPILMRIATEAARYGLHGWGIDNTYVQGSVTPGAELIGPAVGCCPGARFEDHPHYDFSDHMWDVTIDCPASGDAIAHLHCVVEVTAIASGKGYARILAWVNDIPRGEGCCFIPISEWSPTPPADAPEARWEAWFTRAEELISEAYGDLCRANLSHATVAIEPRTLPPVNGAECPCDGCQRAAAELSVAGGLHGAAAVEDRVRILNRKLQTVQPDLRIGWWADVSACTDEGCDAAHVEAIASCQDGKGAILWAMGGETAHEAIDCIEAWAWALLVTDLAARAELGRGEA